MPAARVRAPLDPTGTFDLLPAGAGEPRQGLSVDALRVQLEGAAFELLVPTLMGRVGTVRIPARTLATARRGAPWALEERLLESPEAFHFAVAASGLEGEWVTWAVGRRWLDAIEARLAAVGLRPQAIRPDWIHLPWRTGEWSLLLNGPVSLLRPARWSVVSVHPAALESLLTTLLATSPKPERLRVWTTRDHSGELDGLEACLQAHGITLLRAPPLTGAAALLLAAPGGLDSRDAGSIEAKLALASTRDRSRGRIAGLLQATPRRLALGLLASLLALAGVAQERAGLRARIEATEAAIEASARAALPAGTRVVDAVAQLRQQVGRTDAGDGFSALLAAALPVVGAATTPSLRLRALEYRNRTLQLELSAADIVATDQLVQALDALPELRAGLSGVEGSAPQLKARIRLESEQP
jgi:type II secretion system protein L